jgi:hypothetical protein
MDPGKKYESRIEFKATPTEVGMGLVAKWGKMSELLELWSCGIADLLSCGKCRIVELRIWGVGELGSWGKCVCEIFVNCASATDFFISLLTRSG